jgi:hypothetical protein
MPAPDLTVSSIATNWRIGTGTRTCGYVCLRVNAWGVGLFDIFRKKRVPPAVDPRSSDESRLPKLCYGIAYFGLPRYAFQDCEKLVEMFRKGASTVGPFFYLMACKISEVEPVPEEARGFRAHTGQLDEACDYFILEYPTPPTVDLSGMNPADVTPEMLPVLAPYFSAVVRHHTTGEVKYFTLGQNPIGGTTVRSVTPQGENCNHGPGPKPELEPFLVRLREGVGEWIAKVVRNPESEE